MGSSKTAETQGEKRSNMHRQYGLTASWKACAKQASPLQAYRAVEEEDVSPSSP